MPVKLLGVEAGSSVGGPVIVTVVLFSSCWVSPPVTDSPPANPWPCYSVSVCFLLRGLAFAGTCLLEG